MTTLLHSGHKSVQPGHLWDMPRSEELARTALAESAPFFLGQYRIIECLGSGGMGKVFLAEHQVMNRKVAIKVMSPTLLSDPDSCTRFRQEVRLVAQLSHPHIVLAHDADESEGVHYFVMEYVEGADLGNIVGQYGPLPIAFASECIRQTALGLQHAHEHGLVHCDIKPSNLLLRGGMASVYAFLGQQNEHGPAERPLVKILDFGLARLAGKAGTAGSPVISPDSALCGTPDFMAPELGRDSTTVDIRCDLYSLGCTFSFLLTGHVPYPGGSWSEKLIRHHYDPATPVCRSRPDVPESIEAVVARLMAKDPVDRFATPGEVASAIEDWQRCESRLERGNSPTTNSHSVGQPKRSQAGNRLSTPAELASGEMEGRTFLPAASPRSTRFRLSKRAWPLAACLAVAGGLGAAWIATSPIVAKSVRTVEAWAQQIQGETGFQIGTDGQIFPRLDHAIAAAAPGATIFVHGNGPFLVHGISCQGKPLVIRAASGFTPRIEFLPTRIENDWTPLIRTDRNLQLEGLELACAPEKLALRHADVAHLVYSEGAELKLIGCKLSVPTARALIVARNAKALELDGCTLVSKASALCVEIPANGSTKILLRKSRLETTDPAASTAVLWSTTVPSSASQMDLSDCELVGARLLSINGLDGALGIRATRNTFHFRDVLLNLIPRNSALPMTGLVRWDGAENRFSPGTRWAISAGGPQAIRNLQDWKKCWNTNETGSFEESVATASHPGN